MSGDVREKIEKIFAEIVDGKIKSSEELDKRLSSARLRKVPFYEWKAARKNDIKENRIHIENLKGRRENFCFFIVSLVIGAIGIFLVSGGLDTISTIVDICFTGAIIVTAYFTYKIHRKIKAAEFLYKEWYPYLIIRETAKPEEY